MHITQAARILKGERASVIANYVAKGCIVEAVLLSKLWNDRGAFIGVLQDFVLPMLQKENKLQQIAKVRKALDRL